MLRCSEKDADGYAELKFNGWKDKTHAIDDNNNPVWNQRFYVALDESSKSSILKVEVMICIHSQIKDIESCLLNFDAWFL